jgi:flagellar FliJ protein
MPTAPFTLQPVLSYKENMVDLLERQLAQLLAERRRMQATLGALRAQRSEIHVLLQREQRGTLRLERIQQYRLYLEWLKERIEEEQRRLAELEGRIAAKREELLAMMQDKEMLERLKEKAEDRFLAHLESQEADFNDEIALAQFVRTTM